MNSVEIGVMVDGVIKLNKKYLEHLGRASIDLNKSIHQVKRFGYPLRNQIKSITVDLALLDEMLVTTSEIIMAHHTGYINITLLDQLEQLNETKLSIANFKKSRSALLHTLKRVEYECSIRMRELNSKLLVVTAVLITIFLILKCGVF